MKDIDKKAVEGWEEDFLKNWDKKCLICGKTVEEVDLLPNGMPDMINGAVVGEYIEVYGHSTCVHNVDKIVVMPNRGRVIASKL